MKIKRLIITAAIIYSLTSCNGSREKDQQSLEDISKQELATALEERDQLLALVKDVSTGLEQIKRLESLMTIVAAHPDENVSGRKQILTDISNLKKKIQQRKSQLQDLENRLHDSTINNKEFQETITALRVLIDFQINEIESLRQQLTAANEQIGALKNTVDSLNTTVSTVTGERNAAQEVSSRLEDELNTCHYVISTKSELKEHNIIESGFLRSTRLMKGDFDKDFFIVSDKRMLKILPLNARKVKILTTHPAGSYELVEDNGTKTIIITDPEQFWSLTDYLVVQKD